ncbi:MAG: XdhC family protein [Rhodospirillaceae bacterium]
MKHASFDSLFSRSPVQSSDLALITTRMAEEAEPYVLATVVRTVSVTAAKAGAKAVIDAQGEILAGWIGGGCARGAVLKAAKKALEDGQARLVSIQPRDLLLDQGIKPGQTREGIEFAKNMCPSQGTMDVFVEPVLPRPQLVICGTSPVALALAHQAPSIGLDVTVCGPDAEGLPVPPSARTQPSFSMDQPMKRPPFLVVSTQGKGDLVALEAVLNAKTPARHIAFVGSRKKLAALTEDLAAKGHAPEALARIKGPAGLDLGAITPEEIALSILAEILQVRRKEDRRTVGEA